MWLLLDGAAAVTAYQEAFDDVAAIHGLRFRAYLRPTPEELHPRALCYVEGDVLLSTVAAVHTVNRCSKEALQRINCRA